MAMTSAEVVAKTRRLIQNVDESLTEANYDDELMLEIMEDERDMAELEGFVGMGNLSIDPTADPAITLEAAITLELGTYLANRTAAVILADTLAGRVSRGEMGTSWTSGFEGESTIQASKAYRVHISTIQQDADKMMIRNRAPTAGKRPQ